MKIFFDASGVEHFAAFAAFCAAVADDPHAAGAAFLSEKRLVAALLTDRQPQKVSQLELHRLALKAQPGLERLICLHAAALDAVVPAVLDKVPAGADKGKGDVVGDALIAQTFDPFIMTRTCAAVVLAVNDHLLELTCGKIVFQADRTDKRRAHHALMLKGQVKQNGDPLVGTPLVLAADVEKDILPALSPIGRQAVRHALRPLCQQKEHHVRPLPDNVPCLTAPCVRLLQEEIGGHAHAQLLAALHLIASLSVSCQRIAKACLGAVDVGAAFAALFVQKIHIAVLTALAALDAAVPRVPNIMHALTSGGCYRLIIHDCANAVNS